MFLKFRDSWSIWLYKHNDLAAEFWLPFKLDLLILNAHNLKKICRFVCCTHGHVTFCLQHNSEYKNSYCNLENFSVKWFSSPARHHSISLVCPLPSRWSIQIITVLLFVCCQLIWYLVSCRHTSYRLIKHTYFQ